MRRATQYELAAGLSAVVAGLLVVGCPGSSDEGSCSAGACDPRPDGAVAADAGGGEGGIIKPPDCDLAKEPKDSPACIDDGVGVFVSATGSDGAAGTKAAPLRSIAKALEVAGKKRVYVCEGTYDGFELRTGTMIAGGFACADWKHTGAKAKVQGTTGSKPAIDLVAASVPTLLDLEVVAASKGAPNSVALRAVDTTATLRRVKLVAGEGEDGADGTRTDFNYPLQADLNGNDATAAGPGPEKSFTCPGGAVTRGGKGGAMGESGAAGLPALGAGQGGTFGVACNAGGAGTEGNGGTTSPSADGAKTLGAIAANAWVPQAGVPGPNGSPGQGGGGGCGGAGGGGGGSGGAGGCGGAGGGSGKGGGASIALLSIASSLTLEACELVAAKAGNGGKGVGGQEGQQIFGYPGDRAISGCPGAFGGKGGDGAAGGGGAGGLSAAVVFQGPKPTLAQTTTTPGTQGSGGVGGATPANDGRPGEAKAEHEVPK